MLLHLHHKQAFSMEEHGVKKSLNVEVKTQSLDVPQFTGKLNAWVENEFRHQQFVGHFKKHS
jgi:hypothetical protein